MPLVTQISTAITRIGTEFKSVYTKMGNLPSLTTTDKTSLVVAINEVNAKPTGTGGATINDAAPASTTTTYSASKIEANDALKAPVSHTHTASQISDASTTLVQMTGAQTIAGVKTFSSAPVVPDASFAIAKVTNLSTSLAAKPEINDSAANTATTAAAGIWSPSKVTSEITAARAAVKTEILGAGVPAALDTLDELAAALGDDANFATTTTTALGNRLKVDGTAQTISSANATVARNNIGAQSSADVGDTTTNFVTVFEAALV